MRSVFCAIFVVVAEAVAAPPEFVAVWLVLIVEIDVPAILSMDEELVLTGGNDPAEGIATVLTRGFAVPVVAVA